MQHLKKLLAILRGRKSDMDIAVAVGITPEQLREYENGVALIPDGFVRGLLQAFGTKRVTVRMHSPVAALRGGPPPED